jgi:hypothetical protein
MALKNRAACVVLALGVTGMSAVAQSTLVDLLQRHGVDVKNGALDAAFDSHAVPTVPANPGSFAAPLAMLTATVGADRIDAAYAFGILAGWSGRAASPQESLAAGRAFIAMMVSDDWRSRVAGARVAGRVFGVLDDRPGIRPQMPSGMSAAVFELLNRDREIEQLAAMDALGLLRESSAVASLTERYRFYRAANKRGLAGGALEALARIGDPSTTVLVRELLSDQWSEGKDATALAIAFARERLLKDGSIAAIQQALNEKSRRNQARGYLAELGALAP